MSLLATTAVVNITSFLGDLSAAQRNDLYTSPFTCQAVFRSLPPLAKNYVLRLLLVDVPVPQGGGPAWVHASSLCADCVQGVYECVCCYNGGRSTCAAHKPGWVCCVRVCVLCARVLGVVYASARCRCMI